jgi:hypothetical protein
MKMYVVFQEYMVYDGEYGKILLAVFDSQEKAENYIETLPKKKNGQELEYGYEDFLLNEKTEKPGYEKWSYEI